MVTCAAFLRLLLSIPLATCFDWYTTDFLLAFGDSYTYVQGTYGLQNYSFIGDAFNYSYTPSELLSNTIVQNQIGTSAGGPNWVEYLTGCFSGLPSECKKQLWDFAFAGADVSTAYTPLHHNFSVQFVDQIHQWNEYARPVIPVNVSAALIAAWIGINDIGDTTKYKFPHGNASDLTQLYSEIINTEFEALETLWNVAYKNYLVMQLPPLERRPDSNRPNKTEVEIYNALISSRAAAFAAAHTGSTVLVFDTYTYLTGILDNPAAYGIKNITGYCPHYDAPDIATNYAAYGCLPIDEYFWYNTGHITYKIHGYLAAELDAWLRTQSTF